MEKKKEFECPELIIVLFDDDDIIMTSGPGGIGSNGSEWYEGQFPYLKNNSYKNQHLRWI